LVAKNNEIPRAVDLNIGFEIENKILPTQNDKAKFRKKIQNRYNTDEKDRKLVYYTEKVYDIDARKVRYYQHLMRGNHLDNVRDNAQIGDINILNRDYRFFNTAKNNRYTLLQTRFNVYCLRLINDYIDKYNKKIRIINKTIDFNSRHPSTVRNSTMRSSRRIVSNNTRRSNSSNNSIINTIRSFEKKYNSI